MWNSLICGLVCCVASTTTDSDWPVWRLEGWGHAAGAAGGTFWAKTGESPSRSFEIWFHRKALSIPDLSGLNYILTWNNKN